MRIGFNKPLISYAEVEYGSVVSNIIKDEITLILKTQ